MEEAECEEPASGDKAEAIRRKYCLENNQVYDSNESFEFTEKAEYEGDIYICFEESELDIIYHNGKVFYIHRVKE